MRTYKVISADGHIEGPFDWAARLPAKYKDAAPKLAKRDDDSYAWRLQYGGVNDEFVLGGQLYCGLRYDQFVPNRVRTYWNPDGSLRPGASAENPVQRLREQDQDGIDAEVLFWPAGMQMVHGVASSDIDAYRAIIRMYTDFLAEYCSAAPDRLIGCPVLPQTGVDDAIAEMEHAKKKGLRSVIIQNWPNGSGDPKPEEDDKFWAAALDLDMRITPHSGFGAGNITRTNETRVPPEYVLAGQGNMANNRLATTIGQLMYYGTFDRFPDLKIYFAETQASWLAAHMDYTDEFYLRWTHFHDLKLKKLPSQYIRDHMKFSFIHDRLAMHLRHLIGLDLLMWGSDHPHSVGTFPDSQYILTDLFEGVPEQERRQVLVDNACDFFDLDREKELTPTP